MQQITEDNLSSDRQYTVRRLEFSGRQFYVTADSYPQARDWFESTRLSAGGDFSAVESDLTDTHPVYISRVQEVASGDPVWAVGDADPLSDLLTLGFDFDENAYVFSCVDVTSTAYTVDAASPEQALEMAKAGTGCSVSAAGTAHRVYSCDELTRAIIEGDLIRYRSEDDLTAELLSRYPDGMSVILEDESLRNLLDYRHAEEVGAWQSVRGMIDAEGSRMAGAHGTLDALLQLRPEDYGLLSACDSTYYSPELSDLGWDTEANATSIMFSSEAGTGCKEARIEGYVCPALLDRMLIEGRPYRDIMRLVDERGITDERALHYALHSEFLDRQPSWKVQMATSAVAGEVNRYFMHHVKPVYLEHRQQYHRAEEQAAVENGYADAAAWQRDVGWTRDPSPELADRLRRTVERFTALYLSVRQKLDAALERFDWFRASCMKGFIERFDRQVALSLSDARALRQGTDRYVVRCKIDGVQQPGRTLTETDVRQILDAGDRQSWAVHDVACRHFQSDIMDAMMQAQSRGVKR